MTKRLTTKIRVNGQGAVPWCIEIGPEDTYVSGKWFFIRLLLAALTAAVHELRCSRAIYGFNHRQHRFW